MPVASQSSGTKAACTRKLVALEDAKTSCTRSSLRRCTRPGDGVPGSATRAVELGRPWEPPPGGPRGSPFQMPARLADGLGLGSAPGSSYPLRAPHPRLLGQGVGSPVSLLRKEQQLRRKNSPDCARFVDTDKLLRAHPRKWQPVCEVLLFFTPGGPGEPSPSRHVPQH